MHEMNRMASGLPQNRIDYAPAAWEIGDSDILPDLSLDMDMYKSSVTNILSKHCMEIKSVAEETIQTSTHISKKKLKDLIIKHNNELFSFMSSDKSPLTSAESIFRKYGHEIPTIKGTNRSDMLKELQLDVSLDTALSELNEGLKRNRGEGGIEDFIKQIRWVIHQYKHIGEEVLRLETTLFQKIESLDKLHSRLPLITGLSNNDALPELVQSFSKYAESIYESSHFEENYKELVEQYKKWNICRQILSTNSMMQNDGAEPHCSICLTEPISSTIVPCGHTFCGTCSRKQTTTCYICRGQIRERVKLYFT
jgi:hypothetical protein